MLTPNVRAQIGALFFFALIALLGTTLPAQTTGGTCPGGTTSDGDTRQDPEPGDPPGGTCNPRDDDDSDSGMRCKGCKGSKGRWKDDDNISASMPFSTTGIGGLRVRNGVCDRRTCDATPCKIPTHSIVIDNDDTSRVMTISVTDPDGSSTITQVQPGQSHTVSFGGGVPPTDEEVACGESYEINLTMVAPNGVGVISRTREFSCSECADTRSQY